MYIGEYEHKTDAKGRVIMPTNLREELGDVFYVTQGMEGCLFVYDEAEWANMSEKMKKLRLTSKKARDFSRLFYAPARKVEVDKQGRVLIPQRLREYAKIDKEVIIIGVSTRVEIWAKERYETYMGSDDMDYEMVMDEFEELDI